MKKILGLCGLALVLAAFVAISRNNNLASRNHAGQAVMHEAQNPVVGPRKAVLYMDPVLADNNSNQNGNHQK